jgi:hypothetical protein
MPVHRVVTQIGRTAHKPLGKRWIAVIANLLGLGFPIDQLSLLSPKSVSLGNRTMVEFGVRCHYLSPVYSAN